MLILKNGNVITMTGARFTGDVAVEGGKIVAAGERLDTAGAEVRDVSGCTVMPGVIDAHCHIGILEDGVMIEGDDVNECTDPLTPELRAIDAINPFDRCFTESAAAGVTCCMTGPGSANVVGGQFVTMKTAGDGMEGMTIANPAAMKAAFGENPKRVYGPGKKMPQTRMATAALLRKALSGAQEYDDKLRRANGDAEKLPDRDLGKEALLPVVRRELPLKIHCHRADDILTAIRVAEEFGIRYTLDHCTEGYLICDHLKAALKNGCEGIIVGPLLSERSKIELKNLSFAAPRILDDAGIEFAMMTDHPVIPQQYLPVCAALAVREGLSTEAALRCITINAAKIIGMADRIGSLEAGKDADIAVFAGDPLDCRTRCVLTLIDGAVVHDELGR